MAANKWPAVGLRFMLKTRLCDSGCWEWTGPFFSTGYPQFWMDGTNRKGNRVSWLLFRGAIPESLMVLHSCDNKKCVNPEHLHLGDHAQNMRESSERGRHKRGKDHYMAKRAAGA